MARPPPSPRMQVGRTRSLAAAAPGGWRGVGVIHARRLLASAMGGARERGIYGSVGEDLRGGFCWRLESCVGGFSEEEVGEILRGFYKVKTLCLGHGFGLNFGKWF